MAGAVRPAADTKRSSWRPTLLTLLDTLELDKVGLVGHDWVAGPGFGLSSDTGALPGLPRVGHRPPFPASDVGQGGAIMAWRLSARSERTSGGSGDVASVATAGRRGDSGRHKPRRRLHRLQLAVVWIHPAAARPGPRQRPDVPHLRVPGSPRLGRYRQQRLHVPSVSSSATTIPPSVPPCSKAGRTTLTP